MSYTEINFVAFQVLTAANMNVLGDNDASFNDGTGIANKTITSEKLNPTVAFHAYNMSGTSFTNGSQVAATYATKSFDYGSDFASNTFTAPYNGVYSLSAVGGDWTSAVTRSFGVIKKNGTTELVKSPDGATRSTALSGIVPLTAGDTVRVEYWQSSGAARTGSANAWESFFSGFLVGRTD